MGIFVVRDGGNCRGASVICQAQWYVCAGEGTIKIASSLPLIRPEKEQFVLQNRAANCPTEVVSLQSRDLLICRNCDIRIAKEGRGIPSVCLVILLQLTVKMVRAA